ncbi:MAG: type II toxin-antitoxin system VapC family toxin, partial [Planctomycetota bacterium]
MANIFFDTSALSKRYHAESGSANVDAIFETPTSQNYISRLSVVEMHSVFAKKVRVGLITLPAFHTLLQSFCLDVAEKRLRVIRMVGAHFHSAEQLLQRFGLHHNLRTLDALQLSAALSIHLPDQP